MQACSSTAEKICHCFYNLYTKQVMTHEISLVKVMQYFTLHWFCQSARVTPAQQLPNCNVFDFWVFYGPSSNSVGNVHHFLLERVVTRFISLPSPMLDRCTRRTRDCTTSDISGLNSDSGCRAKGLETRRDEIATKLRQFTWTQRAMTCANRESDFAGYNPSSAGSTIWSSESMSCSYGVAHRTNDCWDLGWELE
jgi:hypothetical protein